MPSLWTSSNCHSIHILSLNTNKSMSPDAYQSKPAPSKQSRSANKAQLLCGPIPDTIQRQIPNLNHHSDAKYHPLLDNASYTLFIQTVFISIAVPWALVMLQKGLVFRNVGLTTWIAFVCMRNWNKHLSASIQISVYHFGIHSNEIDISIALKLKLIRNWNRHKHSKPHSFWSMSFP